MHKLSDASFLKPSYSTIAVANSVSVFRISSVILALLIALTIAHHAAAEDQQKYEQLMQEGNDLLRKGDEKLGSGENARHNGDFASALPEYDRAIELDRRALETFKSAENYAPPYQQKYAVFFEGVALLEEAHAIVFYNRASANLRRGAPHAFCAGLHEIRRSISLGMTETDNRSLYFELGAALVGAGENEEGIQALDRFLISHPDNSAQVNEANKLKADANAAIIAAKSTSPPPKCGKALSALKTPTKEDKPAPSAMQTDSQILWSVTTGVGYDGNVTKLGRSLPIPNGLAGKDAAFNETVLGLESDWFFYHKNGTDELIDKLAVNYAIIHDAYDEHSDSNSLGQTGLISYCRAIDPKSCLGFQIGDTYLRDDTKSLANILAPQVSFTYQESEVLASKISYTLAWNKYFTPTTSLANPDGFTNRIGLEQSFIAFQKYRAWSPSLTLTGQFGHEWTTTDGVVGDRQREDPLFKAEWVIFKAANLCSFVRSAAFSGSYEYRHDDYRNATFPALTAANRFRRQDDTHLADFALSIKMWYDERLKNRLEVILDYKSTTDNSNVPAKAFDEPRFVASLKFNF
jgi:hypothetical protein